MIKKVFPFLMTVVLILGLTVSAKATLTDMGDGTIYDTDLQLTWLKDANTHGWDNWSGAMTWADNLNYAGFSDWRLPDTIPANGTTFNYGFGYDGTHDYGYNQTASEMGYLFYTELGNKGNYATDGTNPQSGWGLSNVGPFTNVQPSIYWSGTEYAPYPGDAWVFNFGYGGQGVEEEGYYHYAWAVRPGYRSTSVPEPGTLMLLGTGLAGVVVWRKKNREQ